MSLESGFSCPVFEIFGRLIFIGRLALRSVGKEEFHHSIGLTGIYDESD